LKNFYDEKTQGSSEASKTFWKDAICTPPNIHVLSDTETEIAEKLGEGQMFEDPDFPAALESLYLDTAKPMQGMPEIEWVRPKDMADVTNPSLFKNGIESDDAIGLKTGNIDTHMWFVSCAAIVAGHPPSLKDLFV